MYYLCRPFWGMGRPEGLLGMGMGRCAIGRPDGLWDIGYRISDEVNDTLYILRKYISNYEQKPNDRGVSTQRRNYCKISRQEFSCDVVARSYT